MYTRCPSCEACYELQTWEVAEAAGVVRCSNCGKTFNALASLFAERPDEATTPLRGRGMPPLLGHRIYQQHEIPGLDAADDTDSDDLDVQLQNDAVPAAFDLDNEPGKGSRRPWSVAAGLLLAALLAQLIWLYEAPARWLHSADSEIASAAAVTLVARDLHAHPSLADAVVISAMLRNEGTAAIEWPVLELRLFDSSNQMIGVRRFQPGDYLAATQQVGNRLAPGRDLPIILEVLITGSQPAGFEFRFF